MSVISSEDAPGVQPEHLERLRSNPAFTPADHLIIDQLASGEVTLNQATELLSQNLQADAAAALVEARQHEVLNDEDRAVLDRLARGEISPAEAQQQLRTNTGTTTLESE